MPERAPKARRLALKEAPEDEDQSMENLTIHRTKARLSGRVRRPSLTRRVLRGLRLTQDIAARVWAREQLDTKEQARDLESAIYWLDRMEAWASVKGRRKL